MKRGVPRCSLYKYQTSTLERGLKRDKNRCKSSLVSAARTTLVLQVVLGLEKYSDDGIDGVRWLI